MILTSRRRGVLIAICLVCLLATGCAKTYYIQRYNGEFYAFDSFKWGDQDFVYKVEFWENGNVKSEAYEFHRKISPVMSEAGNFVKAALEGAKEAF